MEIVVTGRHVTVSDRLREYVTDKLSKVSQLEPRMQRVEVLVSHETNPRQAKTSERVEITCRSKGPVIRAEARHDDRQAAVDLATDKLLERLRRAHDKRKVHRGRKSPVSVAEATAALQAPPVVETEASDDDTPDLFGAVGNSPIEVREKVHLSAPMTLEDALREMELVGHDFYLFHDSETDRASVVYRRRGWSYGVLRLESEDEAPAATGSEG
jgi:ribosomal subunit interface protein